jgi:hypothetical protein
MTDDIILKTLKEHLTSRHMREQAQKMENKYKDMLKDYLERLGDEDDKGSFWVQFDKPLTDPAGKLVTSVKSEKRVRTSLDEDLAESLLQRLGLLEQCQTTITVLDEDAILALNFSGDLSDEELQSIYTTSEPTFALRIYREDA